MYYPLLILHRFCLIADTSGISKHSSDSTRDFECFNLVSDECNTVCLAGCKTVWEKVIRKILYQWLEQQQ